MGRKLTAGALACLATTIAHAQNVQVYGVIDTGIEYVNNVGASGSSLVRMPSLSGGQFPSRWGMHGREDLGGGLNAVFTLESGFAPDTGTSLQGGRIFGRQAFVGLDGDWGTLTAGRHWTMTFFSMLDADVIGPSVFGAAGLDPYLPAARIDNSLSYRGTFNGFTLGGTYSLGRDFSAPANCPGETPGGGCKAWSLMAKYDTSNWGAALACDRQNGGPTGTFTGEPAGTLPGTANSDKRMILNGYYKFGDIKVGGGWIKRDLSARPSGLSTDLYFLGVSMPFGQFRVDAQVLKLHDERPNAGARMAVARATIS